jgi:hypothetical protein
VPNKSTSLKTTLAADAHLAEGQQTSIKEKSEIPSRNSKTNNFQNGRTEFRTEVNVYTHVIPHRNNK